MMVLRKSRMIIVIFALAILFVGALSIVSTDSATARPKCCIWVMYCTSTPPIVCWDVCKPVPCP